jgi:hypothetical protein
MTATASDALDRLLFQPARWSQLSENELIDVLSWGCATYVGVKNDVRSEYLHRLYAHAVETLSPRTRAQVAIDLMRPLEQVARVSGWGHSTAMAPFLKLDPDFVVVSTAALQAAQLMEPIDGDPMTGPREVLDVALETDDLNIQVAMLGGLAALGDGRVLDLIDGRWRGVPRAIQNGFFMSISWQWPTVAGIDFLMNRLERAADEGQSRLVGSIAGALLRLAESARSFDQGRPLTGAGVRDIERVFPSWAVPAEESPVVVRATHSADEIASRILPRLERVAIIEDSPKVLLRALRAWGGDDTPFLKAVERFAMPQALS